MKTWIEFETQKGERFWASCDDIISCITAAKREFPTDRLTILRMEVA